MDNIFVQFAIILTISSSLGLIALKLKLPLIVSYLLAGVVISVLSVFNLGSSLVFHTLPEIGVAFVLFLIGMELDLKEIKTLGLPIITSSIGQIFLSVFLGFLIAQRLGFGISEAIFLGLGLGFSSTVVVVKMLSEHRDLSSLYGKLSIGILLVEDLVAIATLMAISIGTSSFSLGIQSSLPLLGLVLKAVGLFAFTFIFSKYFLEKLFDSVAKSTELLFFTSITWCFLFTSIAVLAGFSIEIGAFLAGVALASSPYHFQIQGKIKPLRDFFLTLFFVYLGSQVRVEYLVSGFPAILTFSLFAIVAKPLIYMLILSRFGFKKHTFYQTSINLSQISEFSLIVLVVGSEKGLVTPFAISVMAAVAVVTIIFSSIVISLKKHLYKFFVPLGRLIERKEKSYFLETSLEDATEDHVVIIGAHRVGGPIAEYLKRENIPFLVMDFNPHIVKKLRDEGMNIVYGDIGDPEVLDSLQLEKTRLIISTAPALEDNEMLLAEVRRRKSDAKVVVRSDEKDQVEVLKKLGADYVILPEKVSGAYLVDQIKNHWPRIVFSGLD